MKHVIVQGEMESLQGFLVRAYRIARIGDVVVRKAGTGTVKDSHKRIDARRNSGSAWKSYSYHITSSVGAR
jgi:hypothetical protein